jgi:tetratricopeptide (TPR) repeat protein
MHEQVTPTLLQVSPYSYFKKSLVLIEQGKDLDAIQHIDCAIVFSSHSPFYIYQKIKLLFKLKHFITCSDYILEQVYFLHNHASLFIVCRIIHYYQLINNLSLDELKKTLGSKEVPSCLADEYQNILDFKASNLFSYAQKAAEQDNFSLCIDYCHLIIKQNKSTWETYYLIAYSYHMLSNLHKACTYYKKCLMLNPNHSIAYNDLALALMELSEFHEAIEYLNKARELQPENIDYLSHIAECYYSLRSYALAQETYESIAKIYPSRIQTYFNLSHICKRQNKKFLSKKYMKIAQKRLKK